MSEISRQFKTRRCEIGYPIMNRRGLLFTQEGHKSGAQAEYEFASFVLIGLLHHAKLENVIDR